MVAATVEAIGTEFGSIVIINPSAPLRPETDYEIFWSHSGIKPRLVKAFQTGASSDLNTPRWKGLARARYTSAPPIER